MENHEEVITTNEDRDEVVDAADTSVEISALKEELSALNDKYLRALADTENVKRRASLDIESVSRNRVMSVLENIIPLVDAIDAALALAPDDEGIQTLHRAAINALAKIGVTKTESVGKSLDPMLHNAISIVTDADAAPNTIVSELQSGYMFGDAVLRTAMVVVSK